MPPTSDVSDSYIAAPTSSNKSHPAQRSLTVFPALPHNQGGRLAHGLIGQRFEKQSFPGRYGDGNETCSQLLDGAEIVGLPSASRNPSEQVVGDEFSNKRESQRTLINQTRKKLDQAARRFSKHARKIEAHKNSSTPTTKYARSVAGTSSAALLPVIQVPAAAEGRRPLESEAHRAGDYKSFFLPSIEEASNSGKSTSRKKKSNSEKLLDAKFCASAKEYRPDFMPLSRTIQVRWKHRRDGSLEYNRDSLTEIYGNFGEIERMLFRAETTVVILYTSMDSACTATRVMQKVGKEMNLSTRWMNEKLRSTGDLRTTDRTTGGELRKPNNTL